jgi:hypothetical protein
MIIEFIRKSPLTQQMQQMETNGETNGDIILFLWMFARPSARNTNVANKKEKGWRAEARHPFCRIKQRLQLNPQL